MAEEANNSNVHNNLDCQSSPKKTIRLPRKRCRTLEACMVELSKFTPKPIEKVFFKKCPRRDERGMLLVTSRRKKKKSSAPVAVSTLKAEPNSTTTDDIQAPVAVSTLQAEHNSTGTDDIQGASIGVQDQDESSSVESLKRLLAEINADLPGEKKRPWASRQHKVVGQWEEVQPALVCGLLKAFQPVDHPCSICLSENAAIKCNSCPGHFLCSSCDVMQHRYSPLHDRFIVNKHYSLPLSACQVITDSEELQFSWKPFFIPVLEPEKNCPSCQSASWMSCEDESHDHIKTCIVVSTNGRYDVCLPHRRCQECGFSVSPTMDSVISAGFWPGSPKITSGMYIFTQDVIRFFDSLVKEKPSMSMRAFLSTLEQISAAHERVDTINPTIFSSALREWRRCQVILEQKADVLPTSCSACGTSPHAIHIDGNKKLYRYKNDHMSFIAPYSSGIFIAPDKDVNTFVNYVKRNDKQETSSTCGNSHFQAARSNSKSFHTQDETGLCVACCRHCVILRGLNMYQGEIFAYPLYLLKDLIEQEYSLSYFCQDVICKFWPYLQRMLLAKKDDACLQKLQSVLPFLGVMHGKAHDWSCQILWGGRWKEGSGTMSGEEMELCNSYLSMAGFITKGMSKTARDEQITEHVLHWNRKKLAKMAHIIAAKYTKTVHELENTEAITFPPETIVTWKEELHEAAKAHNAKDTHDELTQAEIEYVLWASCQQSLDEVASVLVSSNVVSRKKAKLRSTPNAVKMNLTGKEQLHSRVARNLESEIELSYSAIQGHTNNISRLADSCKQRHAIRKKRADEKEKLHNLCKKWMVLQPDKVLSEENRSTGEWPWLEALLPGDNVSLKAKKDAVDKAEKIGRLREEQVLLRKEMRQHITFLKERAAILQEKITSSSDAGFVGLCQFHRDKCLKLLNSSSLSFKHCLSNVYALDNLSADTDLQALLEDLWFDDEDDN